MTEVKWQTRDEMPWPSNPLQELEEILTSTARDVSEDRLLSCIYGIVVGWDEGSYRELREKHRWSDKSIELQKTWHENYQIAWNLFMDNLNKKG